MLQRPTDNGRRGPNHRQQYRQQAHNSTAGHSTRNRQRGHEAAAMPLLIMEEKVRLQAMEQAETKFEEERLGWQHTYRSLGNRLSLLKGERISILRQLRDTTVERDRVVGRLEDAATERNVHRQQQRSLTVALRAERMTNVGLRDAVKRLKSDAREAAGAHASVLERVRYLETRLAELEPLAMVGAADATARPEEAFSSISAEHREASVSSGAPSTSAASTGAPAGDVGPNLAGVVQRWADGSPEVVRSFDDWVEGIEWSPDTRAVDVVAEVERQAIEGGGYRILGDGTFGKVFAAGDFAIKLAKDGREDVQKLEIIAHARVGPHPNIIPVLAVSPGVRGLPIVMKRATCDFSAVLEGKAGFDCKMSTIMRVVRDAGKGLQHMHSQGVVNNDVKPENILVTGTSNENAVAMLADMGLAIGTGRIQGAGAGTATYNPPEALFGDHVAAPSKDVFAWGVTMASAVMLPSYKRLFWNDINVTPEENEALMPDGFLDYNELTRLLYRNATNGSVLTVVRSRHVDEAITDKDGICRLLKSLVEPSPSDRPDVSTAISSLESLIAEQQRWEAHEAWWTGGASGAVDGWGVEAWGVGSTSHASVAPEASGEPEHPSDDARSGGGDEHVAIALDETGVGGGSAAAGGGEEVGGLLIGHVDSMVGGGDAREVGTPREVAVEMVEDSHGHRRRRGVVRRRPWA